MKHCTKCGGEIEDTAKFCTWCGAAVAPAAAAPTPAAAAATVAATAPAAVAAAAVDAMPKPATYQVPPTGAYQAPASIRYEQPIYGKPYSAPQTGTYQQPAGTYQQPTTTYGQPYAQNGASYPSGAAPQTQKDTLGTVALVFLGISALVGIGNAISTFGYGSDYAGMGVAYLLSAVIPIIIAVFLSKKIRAKETISTGFKVVCLIFGSLISGILLFVRDSQNKR
ncbi:MAG: zinc ribbon domain-containing protein [Eggerthellaceae bacterium]|nr:zinc ribbon domain-containing protein [Eggerthellaceae bacterium]